MRVVGGSSAAVMITPVACVPTLNIIRLTLTFFFVYRFGISTLVNAYMSLKAISTKSTLLRSMGFTLRPVDSTLLSESGTPQRVYVSRFSRATRPSYANSKSLLPPSFSSRADRTDG
jgi:hypothetical protein